MNNENIGVIGGVLTHSDEIIYYSGTELLMISKKPTYWWRY